eukprot:m.10704 g.10704  ORF g.10704 m.10704 type:complete len:800 (-) comp4307_c0_seq1:73-2472(-)
MRFFSIAVGLCCVSTTTGELYSGFVTASKYYFFENGQTPSTGGCDQHKVDHIGLSVTPNLSNQTCSNGCQNSWHPLGGYGFENSIPSFKEERFHFYQDPFGVYPNKTVESCDAVQESDITNYTADVYRVVYKTDKCSETSLDHLDHVAAYKLPFCRTESKNGDWLYFADSCNATHTVMHMYQTTPGGVNCSNRNRSELKQDDLFQIVYENNRCYRMQGGVGVKWKCLEPEQRKLNVLQSHSHFIARFGESVTSSTVTFSSSSSTSTSLTDTTATVTSTSMRSSITVVSSTLSATTVTTKTSSSASTVSMTIPVTTTATYSTSTMTTQTETTTSSITTSITTNTIPQRVAAKPSNNWVIIVGIVGGLGTVAVAFGALTVAKSKKSENSSNEHELQEVNSSIEAIKVGEKWLCSKVGCKKFFPSHSQCVMHIRTHTGENPFQCKTCGKQFNQKGNLVRHMRTHSKEKPFKCDSCGKSFSQKQNLQVHIKTHSKQKNVPQVSSSGWLKRVVGRNRNDKEDLYEQSAILLDNSPSEDASLPAQSPSIVNSPSVGMGGSPSVAPTNNGMMFPQPPNYSRNQPNLSHLATMQNAAANNRQSSFGGPPPNGMLPPQPVHKKGLSHEQLSALNAAANAALVVQAARRAESSSPLSYHNTSSPPGAFGNTPINPLSFQVAPQNGSPGLQRSPLTQSPSEPPSMNVPHVESNGYSSSNYSPYIATSPDTDSFASSPHTAYLGSSPLSGDAYDPLGDYVDSPNIAVMEDPHDCNELGLPDILDVDNLELPEELSADKIYEELMELATSNV